MTEYHDFFYLSHIKYKNILSSIMRKNQKPKNLFLDRQCLHEKHVENKRERDGKDRNTIEFIITSKNFSRWGLNEIKIKGNK